MLDSLISHPSHILPSATTNYISVSALDAAHFVVAYQDNGNSDYGTAIIGTIIIEEIGDPINKTDELLYSTPA